jgi:hypothetical protein
MVTLIRPRLRVPVVTVMAGTALAAAWAVRGGPTWWLSIVIGVTVLARAFGVYRLGGQAGDEAALAGSRADERQREVATRASALTGNVAIVGSLAGLALTIAVHAQAAWSYSFAIMLFAAGFSFVFGLSRYGTSEDAG